MEAEIIAHTPIAEPTDGLCFALDGAVVDLLPIAVYVCDTAGRIVRYNPRAAELWGRAPRLGDPDQRYCGALRLFRPDGSPLAPAETPMAEVLRRGEPARDREVEIERPDGSRIWLLVNIAPIRDPGGRLVGAVNCFQEITGRKTTERQLEESRAFLAAVVEATPECVKVVARDGRLLEMNPAGLRMVEAGALAEVRNADTLQLIASGDRARWAENHARVCAGETLSWEFDIVGLQGSRRHMETHAVPLRLPDGSVAQLAVTRDISQRKRDERALREAERQLRELLEALPAAVYTTDAEGRLEFYNEAAAELWGYRPAPGEATWCGSWRLYRPDGRPLAHEECPHAVALKERRAIRHAEAVAERPDGSRVPFAAYPTPIWRADGTLAGAVNMLVDITRHKQAEARQQLLINELNHRVKNTLASVQSIAMHSLRGAETAESFRQSFGARLMALSKAHDLLTRQHWEGAALTALLDQGFAPYRGAQVRSGRGHDGQDHDGQDHDGQDHDGQDHDGQGGDKVRLEGPEVALSARQALVFAMAFHELATNAAKYGALSTEEGRLDIAWTVTEETGGTPAQLFLRWHERGGPRVVPPSRRGFGSRLIERSFSGDLMGEVSLDYRPEGLCCAIQVPLESADAAQ